MFQQLNPKPSPKPLSQADVCEAQSREHSRRVAGQVGNRLPWAIAVNVTKAADVLSHLVPSL